MADDTTEEELQIIGDKIREIVLEILSNRDLTITTLKELKREVEESYDKSRKAKIAGSATAITGSVIAIIGFGLIPVTFGGSLALSVAGSVIAGAGGITSGGAAIGYGVAAKRRLDAAQKACDKDRQGMEKASELASQLEVLLAKTNKSSAYLRQAVFGIVKAGAGGVKIAVYGGRGLKTVVSVARGVVPVAGRAAGIVGAVFNAVLIPIDLAVMIKAANDVHKFKKGGKSNSNAAEKIQKLIDNLEENKAEIKKLMCDDR